jgi:hypothetical protein
MSDIVKELLELQDDEGQVVGNVPALAAAEIERLTVEIGLMQEKLSQYDDLQLCDCCEGLFEVCHDAGGHMQCDRCTEAEKAHSQA